MSDDRRSSGGARDERVVARLERLGNQPVDISAARIDAIETRVLASMVDEQRPSGPLPIPAGGTTEVARRASVWPRIALVAASILAVLALSTAVLRSGDDVLIVASADDVVVLLPGGESVIAKDGTELLDGSTIEVSGFLEVGDRRYGPGRYRVVDGRLVPFADDAIGETEIDPAPATDRLRPEAQDTPERPTVSPTRVPAPSSTRPAETEPPPTSLPPTRPATTTPSRTTTPARNESQIAPTTLPAPTTTEPQPTRPPASAPVTTVTRATTTLVATTTTTTLVRTRSPAVEVRRAP